MTDSPTKEHAHNAAQSTGTASVCTQRNGLGEEITMSLDPWSTGREIDPDRVQDALGR